MAGLGGTRCILRLSSPQEDGHEPVDAVIAVNMLQNMAQGSGLYKERAHIMEISGNRSILPST